MAPGVILRYSLVVSADIKINKRFYFLFPSHAFSGSRNEPEAIVRPGTYEFSCNRQQIEYERGVRDLVNSSNGIIRSSMRAVGLQEE